MRIISLCLLLKCLKVLPFIHKPLFLLFFFFLCCEIEIHFYSFSTWKNQLFLVILAGASLVTRRQRRLLPMHEAQVLSLGQEDLLEEEMETHSSILALEIPWTQEPGQLQSLELQRVRHNWAHMCSGLRKISGKMKWPLWPDWDNSVSKSGFQPQWSVENAELESWWGLGQLITIASTQNLGFFPAPSHRIKLIHLGFTDSDTVSIRLLCSSLTLPE